MDLTIKNCNLTNIMKKVVCRNLSPYIIHRTTWLTGKHLKGPSGMGIGHHRTPGRRQPGQSRRRACCRDAAGRTARSSLGSLGQELKTSDLRRSPSGAYGTLLEMQVQLEGKHTGEWKYYRTINILDVNLKGPR